jgi:hypothetical protein
MELIMIEDVKVITIGLFTLEIQILIEYLKMFKEFLNQK